MLRSPQVRFLLRALASLAVALALWFLLLRDPMFAALRVATQAAMKLLPGDGSVAHATIAANGDWLLQMPVSESVARLDSVQRVFGRVSKDAPFVKVRSLKLTMESKYPNLFTVSLPFFWAISAATPKSTRFLRGLLGGSGILALISVLSLIYFAIFLALRTLSLIPSGFASTLLGFTTFALTDVLPYMSPVLFSLWFYDGLQNLIFSDQEPSLAPAPKAKAKAAVAARGSRGKYRG